MRCDPCLGRGSRLVWRVLSETVHGRQRVLRREPCAACGGLGEVSCCEGKPIAGGDAAAEHEFAHPTGGQAR